MEHLIKSDEIGKFGRPIGKVDADKLTAYITETEQLKIKPAIGNVLFNAILKDDGTNEQYMLLLNGGEYTDNNGILHSFMGLKSTIAYYVYAQNVMCGDFQSTRYGMMLKDGDYSSHISSKERSDHYNNTLEVANQYLKECVAYCRCMGLIQPGQKGKVMMGGITIRKIGK